MADVMGVNEVCMFNEYRVSSGGDEKHENLM